MSTILSIQSLTKKFGNVTAVQDLNLEIQKGEIFGFLGPNGAGKTTTIKLCTGLLKPSRGTVICGNWDIQKNPREAKKMIGFISDQPFVYPLLTGLEFLRFMGDLYGVSRDVQAKKIPEFLAMFELESNANDLVESYSHGMRQKLVIAGVLLHMPEILFIDEPMVGLDPKTGRLVKKIFEELSKRGVCIFLSTHTLELAERLCHRVGIIHRSRLVALGTVEHIRAEAREKGTLEDVFLEITGGTEYQHLLQYL